MHVGMGVIFQGQGEGRTDRNVYRNELRLADLAEPLGFESLWGVEHHFTDYTMCPNVLQYLTYFAGRTQRIQLGSMVVVLPWHDPLRVAEEVVMLDHLSNGRLILGIGRGLGRVEFEGFRVNQEDSRAIFVEATQMILQGLERGYWNSTASSSSRRVASCARGRSSRSGAHLCRRGFARIVGDHGAARDRPVDHSAEAVGDGGEGAQRLPPHLPRRERHRCPAADRRRVGLLRRQRRSRRRVRPPVRRRVLAIGRAHYELIGDHLTKMRGYESYRQMQEMVSAPGGVDAMTEFFVNLQVTGTPEQCYEKILDIQKRTGAEAFNAVFSYGAMPYDLVDSSMRLFAAEVMPELKRRIPIEDQLIARAGVGQSADAGAFRLPI